MADRRHSAFGSTAPGHYGPAPAGVTLAELRLTCAWNLQGDAARPAFGEGARRLFGVALPATPNTTARSAALTLLWLGPTSWLVVANGASTLTDFAAKRAALNDVGGALFDVTASCIGWTVAGPRSETVLAKGCPLDFDSRAFAESTCAQSVFGHVNALFYRRGSFTLIVARSYARSVWRTLCLSAAQYGYDVLPVQIL